MNAEKQRIKIAEACGWEYKTRSVMGYGGLTSAVQYYWSKNESVDDPPDYLNDLNAMHEAEQVLNERQRQTYAWQIIRLARKQAGIDEHESHYPVPFVLFATAAQRAEAFLRTLNLWEE